MQWSSMIFERKSPTDSVSIIDMHINKQLPTNNQVFPSHAKCSQAYDFNLLFGPQSKVYFYN